MELFLDTANVEEIRRAADMGVICGVTTNPSLIAREGRDFYETVAEITTIVDGPVSAEVMSEKGADMVREAQEIRKKIKSDNLVIKIPMTAEGLHAVRELTRMGIRTNVTLVFSSAQALLAACAGATYVSPFLGRLDDIGESGLELIREIASLFAVQHIGTKIIAASIRTPGHVIGAAAAGAQVVTLPYKVLCQMVHHPLTDAGIERFVKDWKAAGLS